MAALFPNGISASPVTRTALGPWTHYLPHPRTCTHRRRAAPGGDHAPDGGPRRQAGPGQDSAPAAATGHCNAGPSLRRACGVPRARRRLPGWLSHPAVRRAVGLGRP